MNQQPPTAPAADQPSTPPPSGTIASSYLMPLDSGSRDDLLDALRVAADRIEDDLNCVACTGRSCTDIDHAERTRRVHAWRGLGTEIARLPGIADDEPMIRFDPDACRAWLQAWAAHDAGIDEGFNTNEGTIAAGLEDLLSGLNNEPPLPGWQTVAHLQDVQIWRTADSDGVDGGGILTADLNYMGQRVRLASLHQSCDEFTDDPAISGVDAAVQALGHVADTLNREYTNFRRATGHRPGNAHSGTNTDDGSSMYTVVGVWVDDEPVPVGVIAGEHEVSGGDDYEQFPQGVWATSVTAAHDLEAERYAIDQMRAENQ